MPEQSRNKKPTSLRLSAEALWILKEIALRKGISQASSLEILLREEAARLGLGGRDE